MNSTNRSEGGHSMATNLLLDIQGLSTIYKPQIRNMLEFSQSEWANATPIKLKMLETIHPKVAHVLSI